MENEKFKIYNLKFAISRSDMYSPACQKPLADRGGDQKSEDGGKVEKRQSGKVNVAAPM